MRILCSSTRPFENVSILMEANACDYQKLQSLSEDKEAAQGELDGLYERWEALSLQLEELQS